MKKLFYTILILLVPCTAAHAQATEKGISIENLETVINGETLDILFTVRASQIDIKRDGQLKLEFVIESPDRRLVLPAIIYSGTQRYRYERRKEELSGAYTPEPYYIFKGVKKDQNYGIDYRMSVPYYTWMEHAAITYREYTHECSGDQLKAQGMLVADLNPAPVYVEPELWKPDSGLFPSLVSFLVPEVEKVKARVSMIELNIGFPVNVTEVRPAFGDNTNELARADELITKLQSDELITINSINIRGYASPEGSYAVNERLARGRSESFKQYLVSKYPANEYVRNAHTSWVPEDWEGFGRLVEELDFSGKDEVLAIVNDPIIASDTKDRVLQKISWWSNNYKMVLTEMFPKLRRIELRVDYTIQKLDDATARERLYTTPELLSLDEIFRVARFYEPGSRQYREVYEIAARQYPDNVIANNNAAAALLQEGNAEAAKPYLEKIGEKEDSYINLGAYYYIMEDLEKALDYFEKAKEAGIEQGEYNLGLANPQK